LATNINTTFPVPITLYPMPSPVSGQASHHNLESCRDPHNGNSRAGRIQGMPGLYELTLKR
jgi:hypothetical protein